MEEKRLRLAAVDMVEELQYSPINKFKLLYEHVASRVEPFIAAGYAVKDCSYQYGKLKIKLSKPRPLV